MSDLKIIPGVGKDMEQHFFDIGIRTINDLNGKNPEKCMKMPALQRDAE